MQTLLKGGTVVSGTGMPRADVRIDGEKIVQVGRKLDGGEAQVIDVTGCLLFPGFIDAHTHFDLDVAVPPPPMTFTPAAGRPCGAAPPPSSTSPVPTRANPSATDWTSGIERPTGGLSAITAST